MDILAHTKNFSLKDFNLFISDNKFHFFFFVAVNLF